MKHMDTVEGTYTHTHAHTITPAPTQPHAHINKHTNKHTIAQPIPCPHFHCRQLSVKCNEITEIGAFSLCHALDQCPTLYNLDLQGNMIGCEAVDVFLARKSTQVLLRNFVCLCLCVSVSACLRVLDGLTQRALVFSQFSYPITKPPPRHFRVWNHQPQQQVVYIGTKHETRSKGCHKDHRPSRRVLLQPFDAKAYTGASSSSSTPLISSNHFIFLLCVGG